MKHILYSSLILFFIPLIALCQPGTLDPAFGKEGKVITHFDDAYLFCYAGALQNDGKLLAGGRLQKLDDSYYGFEIIRYNTDGTIDDTFGNGGQVLADFGKFDGSLRCMAVTPNGQIIAVGYGFKANPNLPDDYSGYDDDILMACYNTDGTLDSSFGTNGKTVTDLGKDERAAAITLQQDGKVLVTGYSKDGVDGNRQMLTLRYTADGKPDETFGKGGSVIYPYTDNEGAAIAVDAEGKIIVGGTYHFPDVFFIVRYLSDGTMDATFGNKGKTYTTMDAGPVAVNSVLVLKDGNILAAGVGSDNMMVVRYTKDGIIDASFGKEGRMPIVFKEGSSHVQSAFEQPDGKIILAGGVGYYLNPNDFALASMMPDGSLDKEFGDIGKVVTDFGKYESAFTALQQGDGKIVLVGKSLQYFSGQANYDFALARYNTSQSAALPLALTQFSAMQNERGVALNWQTATETNTNYFSVQRNIPNSAYTEIAKVKSLGYSTAPHNYTYIDNAPAAGANTYQLKVVDKDGTATYSKAALVNYSVGKVLKLYPNPAHNTVTVAGLNAGATTTISLLDARGKTVKRQVSSGSAKNSVSIANLAAGTYYLKAESGSSTTTIKFVKE